jgi:hypothetical protein
MSSFTEIDEKESRMESVAGIFNSRPKAEQAVAQIKSLGLPDERIVLLTPDTPPDEVEAEVNTTDAEPPGIGSALGGTVGGALGVASGATLGAAAASLMVPGVGPVLALGILGAAVLGLGGTVTGMAVGGALDETLDEGLPHDELFIYEDALRRGRTVVIAFPDDEELADSVRQVLAQAGAESIDAGREDWWLGLRDAEEEHYRAQGGDFHADEVSYRRGFEASLNTRFRGRSFAQCTHELEKFYAESGVDEAFRQGFERGIAYQNQFQAKSTKASSG